MAFIWFALLLTFLWALVYRGELVRICARHPAPLGVPLTAGLLFVLAPQIGDMMLGLRDGAAAAGFNRFLAGQFGFGLAANALGFQSWYWLRASLNADHGYLDKAPGFSPPWPERIAPRLGVLLALFVSLTPLLLILWRHMPYKEAPWPGIVIGIGLNGFFFWWVWMRHRKSRSVEGSRPTPLRACRVRRLIHCAPFSKWWAFGILLVSAGGIVLPQAAGGFYVRHIHSISAAILGLACLVPLLTFLLAAVRDGVEWLVTRLPLRSPHRLASACDRVGLMLMLVVPIAGGWAAERVGAYKIEAGGPLIERPTIEKAAADAGVSKDGGRAPIILVLEGGASRSAVWSLSVMRMLDAATGGRFSQQLFAISSVSGGSLAAVTYAMLRGHNPAGSPIGGAGFWARASPGLTALAHADLLSSTAARLFTVDIATGLATRATALGAAFEEIWFSTDGFGFNPHAAKTFLALRGDKTAPQLLLNGTDVGTGSRVITSTLAFKNTMNDSLDLLGILNGDVSAADAVLNSARFPIISPPGLIPLSDGESNMLTVVDGGVFEGYGARTAHEVAFALREYGAMPIVVVIRNDASGSAVAHRDPCHPLNADLKPNLQADFDHRVNIAKPAGEARGIWVPEFLTSAIGLNAARGAHGQAELLALRHDFCLNSDGVTRNYFEFDLPISPDSDGRIGSSGVPLNWVLTDHDCDILLGTALRSEQNVGQTQSLVARLGADVPFSMPYGCHDLPQDPGPVIAGR